MPHEAPVIAASLNGAGLSHGVGPSVVPDDKHVLVDRSGDRILDGKAAGLYPQIVSIVVS